MGASPNIILITTDQQRYDSVGANGNLFIRTPNLDRLASEGVRFTRAYCPNTVCTPSRASLMTGFYLSRHGAYNIGTSALNHTEFISSILRSHGYQTYHVGKAHFFPWGTQNPETAGVDISGTPFTDFAGFEGAEVCRGHAGPHGVTGHYRNWLERNGINVDAYPVNRLFEEDDYETGDWLLPVEFHSGNWIVDRVSSYLTTRRRDRPFFLNVGFPDPHHPHILPKDYRNRVPIEKIPEQWPHSSEYQATPNVEHLQNGTINNTDFRGEFGIAGNQNTDWRTYFADEHKGRVTKSYYYSMVQLIDDQVGHILRILDELGLRDNTMVIFTSDHGEMLGDHWIGQKGPLIYDGVTRIPLFIRYPKRFAPRVIDDCVSLVDIVPTLMEITGIRDDIKRDGVSLVSLLDGSVPLSRPGVRIEYKEEPDRLRFKCWVTKDWKLAIYSGEEFGELYNLRQDPNELHNLFNDPRTFDVKLKLILDLLGDMERSEPVYLNRPSRV